jgi:aspartate-semialdehyde dehydrogenase
MNRIKVGILGCTGLVGQQFVRLLDRHPYFEIASLAASSRSSGKKYADAASWAIQGDPPESVKNKTVIEASAKATIGTEIPVWFNALPAVKSRALETSLRARGKYVFSNASSHRMDDDVPILIPEVNAEHLELALVQKKRYGGFIVCCSNCSASGIVTALKPLLSFGLRSVACTTFQALSGAGRRGVAALDIQGNVVPYIQNEEEKIRLESKKILGTLAFQKIEPWKASVWASCCRVPVRDGHLESLFIEFDREVDRETLIQALSAFVGVPQRLKLPTAPVRPIIVRPEEDRPQPALDVLAGSPDRAGGMALSVGRIRVTGPVARLFLLVHNTIRGAAGTCVLNAELAYRRGLFARQNSIKGGAPCRSS